jgi:hypothetical protein
MSTSRFAPLDKHTVVVEMDINGRQVHLTGVAAYARVSDLGAVLKIHVADPAGDFDLILREDRWKGKIEEDRQSGCHFRISLSASDLVTQNS